MQYSVYLELRGGGALKYESDVQVPTGERK